MGFFKMFTKKKKTEKSNFGMTMTPAMRRKAARRLLNDDKMQNNIYPPGLYPECNEKYTPDENPNSTGAFGHSPDNPILCNKVLGEVAYLSKLVLTSGEKIFYHRNGSCRGNSIEGVVDVFEIISQSGKFHDTLYMDMYHNGKSSIAPAGYKLEKKVTDVRGCTSIVRNFPENLYESTVMECMRSVGADIADEDIKNIDIKTAKETMKL